MKRVLKAAALITMLAVLVVSFCACDMLKAKDSSTRPGKGEGASSPKFTLSFDTDGGSNVPAIRLAAGATLSAPENPSKEEYTFAGWFLGESATAYEFSTMPAENITLTAHWTGNRYTVIFDSNGGTEIPAAEVTYGESYGELPVPEKTGYAFGGWYENVLTPVTEIKPTDTGNRIYRAKWIPIEYNVTYVLNGGTNNPANPYVYTIENLRGADGTLSLKTPEKKKKEIGDYLGNGLHELTTTEYTFEGWYMDSSFTTPVTELSLSLGTVTLYAKWGVTRLVHSPATYYKRINADGTANASGQYILFGEYPQTKITDSATISALGDYAANTWKSYGYYINEEVSDFMKYTDKEYNGAKYRGVYFTSYRPNYCGNNSGGNGAGYGYHPSTVYWFRYEPIKWRILNEVDGKALILCDKAIDSQQFDYDGFYRNNYKESTIRKWLNDIFYPTAFSDRLKALIQITTVDNSASSTARDPNQYACENTNDKIFLLSYTEADSLDYTLAARVKMITDYALSQGCYGYGGRSRWWLRSPHGRYDNEVCSVDCVGSCYENSEDVNYTSYGVVPALTISL